MANAFIKIGDYDAAVKMMEDGLKQNINNPSFYRKIAQIRINEGKYNLAIAVLNKSLKLRKSDDTIYLLGHSYFYNNNIIKAKYFLKKVDIKSNYRSRAIFLLARIYIIEKNFRELELLMNEMRTDFPDAYAKIIKFLK